MCVVITKDQLTNYKKKEANKLKQVSERQQDYRSFKQPQRESEREREREKLCITAN